MKAISVVKILLVISPLLVSLAVYKVGDEFASVPFIGPIVIGIPAIILIGKLVSRRLNDQTVGLIGYVIPAIIVNAYGLFLAWPML